MEMNPRTEKGFWCWRGGVDGTEVCFAGRGPGLEVEAAVRVLVPAGVEPAWLKQVHSAAVVDAVPGCAGRADALVTRRSALALAVVTADCVPVLLAGRRIPGGGRELAAVHAGWRGIEGRVVPAVLERLDSPGAEISAWVGPAIGPCCYEVGDGVAARVAEALRGTSAEEVVCRGRAGRPHLDLRAAVESQLRERGTVRVRHVERCTRCDAKLWSYRRDGPRTGRNLALIYST